MNGKDPAAPSQKVEPSIAEVEGAHVLANEAADRLRAEGLDDEEIRRLADRFVAEDRGGDVEAFVAWARDVHARHS
jgi:hypothetical protein